MSYRVFMAVVDAGWPLFLLCVAGLAFAMNPRRGRQAPGPQAERRTGPVPAAGQVDTTDYVRQEIEHRQCENPCQLHGWTSVQHCRCGDLWVCPLAGPLNAVRRAARRDGREWWS